MAKVTVQPKLEEIGKRISAHLKRFEADPAINKIESHSGMKLRQYYYAGASATGSRVRVTYVSYQGGINLKKVDALAYLKWLDEGNIGTHYSLK